MSGLSEVLAAHSRLSWSERPFTCTCEPDVSDATGTHTEHLAAILDAREAAWRGEREDLLRLLGAAYRALGVPQTSIGVTTPGSANEGRRTAHSDSESYAWPTNGSGK